MVSFFFIAAASIFTESLDTVQSLMRYADTINFIKKLNLKKVSNALKIVSSYYLTKYTSTRFLWGLPFTLSVEPTTNCNLGCPECPSGLKQFTRPTGSMSFDHFQQIVDQTNHHLIYLYLYFQGEPYMNPKFLDSVKYASNKGIYTVTSTNAHYITPRKAIETVQSGLDRIIISIDGTTQEVYEQYRVNGSLEKVISGAKNLVNAKRELKSKTPHIIFQFLVVKPNEHQIPELFKLAKEVGVDEVKLKTAQINNYQKGSNLIPENKQYSRYKQMTNGEFKIKNSLSNHCSKIWHSAVITWDGKMVPCCFDKDAHYEMGNALQESVNTLWSGNKFNKFRDNVLKSRKEVDICTNCSEGTKVWS